MKQAPEGRGRHLRAIADGRFSGATSGLSIGPVSPEAAEGGLIALVETGDPIEIDVPNRSIRLALDDATLDARRETMVAKGDAAWRAHGRNAPYPCRWPLMPPSTNAARGAVRDVGQIARKR